MSRPRIVLLGDSITAGCHETGVTSETTWPALLKPLLNAAELDVELIVSALHGVYVDYAVRRFTRMVARHQPDHVLILLGSNDAASTQMRPRISAEHYRDGLESLVGLCRQHSASPIIASPPPRTDDGDNDLLCDYADVSSNLSETTGVDFIDLFGGLSKVEFLSELLPDCQHPNPSGNRIIAELVAKRLVTILSAALTVSY